MFFKHYLGLEIRARSEWLRFSYSFWGVLRSNWILEFVAFHFGFERPTQVDARTFANASE